MRQTTQRRTGAARRRTRIPGLITRIFVARIFFAGILATGLVWAAAASQASASTLTGSVLNGMTGQPLRGAVLDVEGADTRWTTDLEGIFRGDLPPGTYAVVVSKPGFESQKVTDVEVGGGTATFSAVLLPLPAQGEEEGGEDSGTSTFSEAITVEAEANTATEDALLAERRRAAEISDSIGIEEIGKNTGSDAAGVLKRVTGISLQDDKYVYVRGLGDRYSNTSLNGTKIPSTEFEKKVVPLDLFPSDLLEKITVAKSYTVDKPGDFVAGVVELVTREFPVHQAGSVGASVGFNSETTGEGYLRYGDGLSFSGAGGQPLPAGIPNEALSRFSRFTNRGFTPEQLEVFGEELIGIWTPSQQTSAPADQSYKASYGNSFDRLGFVVSASYENGFSTRQEEANIFQSNRQGGVTPLNSYDFDFTDEKVRQAYTGNLSYRFGNNHEVSARSLLTTLSTNESRFQEGFFSDISANIENSRLSHLEQQVFSAQLAGDHFFNSLGSGGLFEWSLSSSTADTGENRREVLYEEQQPGRFVLTDNAQSGFMYFNDLEDDVFDSRADWSSFINGGNHFGSIKAGVAYTDNQRLFDGRRLRYFHRNVRGLDLSLPPEELFTPENIGPNGFELEEITRPTDTYAGDHTIAAAYVQADVAWGKWRVIGGVRVEDSNQQVVTLDRFQLGTPPVISEVVSTDPLPSVNVVYQLRRDANLRFSASRTVNRPEYRELAPFEFTHIVGGFTVSGNPDLERAEITSFDARWEWFPKGGEVVAASLFFKDFTNPIENVLLSGAIPKETFQNVPSARNFGLELEFRRSLGFLSPKLAAWTAILNYTYVDSKVTLDPDSTVLTNTQRPLVGQPDNVVNAILEWQKPRWGSAFRLLVNFIDNKVAQAGGFGLPDVIENSRTTVDLVWRQDLDRLAPGLSLKLSGTNLTDEKRLWTQADGIFRGYEPGRGLSLSASYHFF